jgi:pimeloyl-ACP methyl ester carboxylesterase
LVIHGEEDNLIPVAQAKRMSEKIPQGKWGVIPKAGHVSNLENPKLFNQYLLEFLEIIF